MSSGEISEHELKFWEDVGLIIVYPSDGGVIIGRIIDIKNTVVTIRDIYGCRHWISREAIGRITEVGEKDVT